MKNVIIGMLGGFLLIYTTALGLGIYRDATMKNALSDGLASGMYTVFENYYVGEWEEVIAGEQIIRDRLTEDLKGRLAGAEEVRVTLQCCNMNLGVLSVKAEVTYRVPGGARKKISEEKTLIADQHVY